MLNTSTASSHVIGKRVTVESGSTSQSTITENTLLDKKNPEIVGQHNSNDTVTLTGDHSGFQTYHPSMLAPAAGPSGYSALSSEDKQLARQVMRDLDKKARLFARDENEQLVRISPATGKQMLDAGEPVEVVRALGEKTESWGRSGSESYSKTHFTVPNDHAQSSFSKSKSEVSLNYSASAVSDWDALLWHEGEDYKGIPGTPKLPPTGNSVTVSREWESKWQSSSVKHEGFWKTRTYRENDQGYERTREVAQG